MTTKNRFCLALVHTKVVSLSMWCKKYSSHVGVYMPNSWKVNWFILALEYYIYECGASLESTCFLWTKSWEKYWNEWLWPIKLPLHRFMHFNQRRLYLWIFKWPIKWPCVRIQFLSRFCLVHSAHLLDVQFYDYMSKSRVKCKAFVKMFGSAETKLLPYSNLEKGQENYNCQYLTLGPRI